MTVVRARSCSGAGKALRTLICGVAAALVLTGSGCGGNNTLSNGTPVITVTDTSGDFTAYIVTLSGIALTRNDGASFSALGVSSTTERDPRIDLARLTDLSELLSAPAVPSGTYTSASITLDYSTGTSASTGLSTSPIIQVDVNGQSQALTPTDQNGKTLGAITFTIKFDPKNPLVVNQGKSVRLALDIDLATSNIVDLTTNTVKVKPFLVATAKLTDTKPVRVRGTFLAANTGPGSYTINVRPLHYQSVSLGALTVQTGPQTYFNVNGKSYVGPQGLAAMAQLPINTMAAAFGSIGALSDITPAFNATAVYVGTSLDTLGQDEMSGLVTARSGDILTVHGATYVNSLGEISYSNNSTLQVADSTIVSEDGTNVSGLGKLSISVGQRIDASGQPGSSGSNITLNATKGQVRLAPTPFWGLLNSATAGSLSLNLQSIEVYEPSAFNFAGTGTSSANDATAGNYAVNTGAIDASANAAGSLLRVDGFANAFGAAPPAFNATAVTPGSSIDSQLIVEWPNGATAPFSSYGPSGLVIDRNNANLGTVHVIRTGPSSLDLKSLPASPLITTAAADPNAIQLALGNPTNGISVFSTAADFATSLTTLLNGTNAVSKLVAVGRYNAGTQTFNATRINVVQQ